VADCVYGGETYSEGSLICVNGKELSCYAGVWAETGRTCTSFDIQSASVQAAAWQLPATIPTASYPPYEYRIDVGRTIDRKFPHVYTLSLPAKILRLVGQRTEGFSVACRLSGESTTVLVVEGFPYGVLGASYRGAAICTVVY